MYLGFTLSAILPLIALTDDANGVHQVPIIHINEFLIKSFILGCFVWLFFACRSVWKLSVSFDDREKFWFVVLKVMIGILIIGIVFIAVEIKYIESEYA